MEYTSSMALTEHTFSLAPLTCFADRTTAGPRRVTFGSLKGLSASMLLGILDSLAPIGTGINVRGTAVLEFCFTARDVVYIHVSELDGNDGTSFE